VAVINKLGLDIKLYYHHGQFDAEKYRIIYLNEIPTSLILDLSEDSIMTNTNAQVRPK